MNGMFRTVEYIRKCYGCFGNFDKDNNECTLYCENMKDNCIQYQKDRETRVFNEDGKTNL